MIGRFGFLYIHSCGTSLYDIYKIHLYRYHHLHPESRMLWNLFKLIQPIHVRQVNIPCHIFVRIRLCFHLLCKKTSFWGGAVDNNLVMLIHHRVKSKGLTRDNGCLARKWNMGVNIPLAHIWRYIFVHEQQIVPLG